MREPSVAKPFGCSHRQSPVEGGDGRAWGSRFCEAGRARLGVAERQACIDSDRKSPGEECIEFDRFEWRALKDGAPNVFGLIEYANSMCGARKMYPRKPAARRSDCIGKLGCHLQTGRGAAYKLVLFRECDRKTIRQLALNALVETPGRRTIASTPNR